MDLSEEQRRDLMELQNLQQQLQMMLMQKQQLLLQQSELENAGEEVEKSPGPFHRFAGGILIPKEKAVLQGELKEDKENTGVRLNAFSKQEKKLKERFEELRKKLEKSLPGLGGGSEPSVS
ncbi:MAG: prefoldin subunit [Candidatus Micrarchaeota archaeon]